MIADFTEVLNIVSKNKIHHSHDTTNNSMEQGPLESNSCSISQ